MLSSLLCKFLNFYPSICSLFPNLVASLSDAGTIVFSYYSMCPILHRVAFLLIAPWCKITISRGYYLVLPCFFFFFSQLLFHHMLWRDFKIPLRCGDKHFWHSAWLGLAAKKFQPHSDSLDEPGGGGGVRGGLCKELKDSINKTPGISSSSLHMIIILTKLSCHVVDQVLQSFLVSHFI